MEGLNIEDFSIECFDLWVFEVLDKVDGALEWDGVVDGRCLEASERAFSIAWFVRWPYKEVGPFWLVEGIVPKDGVLMWINENGGIHA